MTNTVVLQTFKGKVIGSDEEIEHDFDEVKVNGQRVAFVPHAEGSGIRFLRHSLSAPTIRDIQEAVQQQRKEQGKAPISDKASMPPTPEKLKGKQASL